MPQKKSVASALIKRHVFVGAGQGTFFMSDKNHKRHDNKNIPLNKCRRYIHCIRCIPIHERILLFPQIVLFWMRHNIVDGVNNKRPN